LSALFLVDGNPIMEYKDDYFEKAFLRMQTLSSIDKILSIDLTKGSDGTLSYASGKA
jgi:hypothetical protein